ncbi:hypothetical protein HWV62_588 [Athelia sp. TMB]|nr:hypothetical protein HWV62_588 [Athelia sp. TMB]
MTTTFAPSPLSPAAFSTHSIGGPSPLPRRSSFPTSRALRPFPSITHSSSLPSSNPTPGAGNATKNGRRTLKLIEPPKNLQFSFQLNLTQAEFSRQK